MKTFPAFLCPLLLLVFIPRAHTQHSSVSGTIRNAGTLEPLPAAIVRVLGTSYGTVCNAEGEYRLLLPSGRHSLVFSSLGYLPDTAHVLVPPGIRQDARLTPSDITLPEILVTGEDPAREIIRQAIANKRRWIDRLQTYEMDAFTRQVLRRDTAIASITEAYTKGYWQRGDTLREIITQRRQTENIASSFNYASVGRLLNFYEENIRFLGYSFVGPIAHNAFDHYDFKLLRTRSSRDADIFEIDLIPLSSTVPLFSGTVSITGGSYALVAVDVVPTQSFLLPFVKEKTIRYRQQFALYEQTYWLPADIRIEAQFTVGIIGFSIPAIGFSQNSVITNYRINEPIPDSIFQKPRLVIDSSATVYDSTLWASPSVLPLTAEEQQAYATLDSTQSLDIQFRPGGIAMTFGVGDSGAASSIVNFLDISFNRVEGAHLGVQVELNEISPFVAPRAGFAYGFSDRLTKYAVGATVFPFKDERLAVGGEYHRELSIIPDRGYYEALFNSFTALLDKNDYRDYYLSKGWQIFADVNTSGVFKIRMAYLSEEHTTAVQNTDYSLLRRSRPYRVNPVIDTGTMRSFTLQLQLGASDEALGIVTRSQLAVSMEFGTLDRQFSSSDFERYEVAGTLVFPTIGRRFLFPAQGRIRIAAGTSSGDLRQRHFAVETASSGYSPFGTMKAMRVKEFVGGRYLAVNAEHNFRSLPFLALGIPFLYENNIEFIIHGGAATVTRDKVVRIWDDVLYTRESPWYYEAGFGISRIFEVLRADFTWRLSQERGFRFTLGVANLF